MAALDIQKSFWVQGSWQEIHEKVQYLLESFEKLRNERKLSEQFEKKLDEEKQVLEIALHRRNRNMEEVWRYYEQLKYGVEAAVEIFPYKEESLYSTSTATAAVDAVVADAPTPKPHPERKPRSRSRSQTSLLAVGEREEPPPPSDSSPSLPSPSHVNLLQTTTSCIDAVAHTLRSIGLEILDEDQRLSPTAGIAFTVALVAAVCILSHCHFTSNL